MSNSYKFKYFSGPDTSEEKTHIQTGLKSPEEAEAFANGLRLGGATKVRTIKINSPYSPPTPIKGIKGSGTRDVCMETSAGVVRGSEAKGIEMAWEVKLMKPDYGCFEIWDKAGDGEDFYAEGGLWFSDGKLVDYDGVFELDKEILEACEKMGFNVDEHKS